MMKSERKPIHCYKTNSSLLFHAYSLPPTLNLQTYFIPKCLHFALFFQIHFNFPVLGRGFDRFDNGSICTWQSFGYRKNVTVGYFLYVLSQLSQA